MCSAIEAMMLPDDMQVKMTAVFLKNNSKLHVEVMRNRVTSSSIQKQSFDCGAASKTSMNSSMNSSVNK